jgi:hypothetical protein
MTLNASWASANDLEYAPKRRPNLGLSSPPAGNWGEGPVLVLRLCGAVLAFSVLGAAPVFAQSAPSTPLQPPPLHGFVPPYEILRTVRAAGFDPLAPPLRQGTIYVVRAIDYRGVAMRVVVDAHSGAIRDANRIVSGLYGPYAPGPYPPPPYGRLGAASTYSPPDDPAVYGRPPFAGAAEPANDLDELRGASPRAPHSAGSIVVPLPRPRPGGLAASAGATDGKPVAKPVGKPDVAASASVPRLAPSGNAAKAPPAIND